MEHHSARPPDRPTPLSGLADGPSPSAGETGRQLLWNKALAAAFPKLTGAPGDLVDQVDHIYELRNRVAHLEPLLNSGMVADRFARMRAVLLAIDPALETWFVSRQRVTAVLKTKP